MSRATTVWRCGQRRLNCSTRAVLFMATGLLNIKGCHNHDRPITWSNQNEWIKNVNDELKCLSVNFHPSAIPQPRGPVKRHSIKPKMLFLFRFQDEEASDRLRALREIFYSTGFDYAAQDLVQRLHFPNANQKSIGQCHRQVLEMSFWKNKVLCDGSFVWGNRNSSDTRDA